MSRAPALLVFAKAPLAGAVKTRLAAAIGAERAAAVYRALLETTLACAAAARAAGIVDRIELWCTPDADHPHLRSLAERHAASRHRQPDGDLGLRMRAAFADALPRVSSVLLVGTDCPALQPGHIAAAATALATHDAVVVPAEDGGYVLVGARRPLPFANVRWSTPHALADTLAGFAQAGLACARLAPLWDVDDAADLARWEDLQARARVPHA
jgi:rSAM/selenodomain-associated transferase 1